MKRTVKLGLMAYVNPEGFDTWGFAGDEVDVHPENVERFDSLNVLPGDSTYVEPALPPEFSEAERPAGNASLEVWQEFAESKGVDVEGLSRNEIRDQFA